jgi:transposase-like protein
VSEVARPHGISPQHLFVWRKAARAGLLSLPADEAPLFVPVVTEPRPAGTVAEAATRSSTMITIEIGGGSRGGRGRPSMAARSATGREGSNMIAASAGVKIMVATKPVDFRTDGLVALASNSAMIRSRERFLSSVRSERTFEDFGLGRNRIDPAMETSGA